MGTQNYTVLRRPGAPCLRSPTQQEENKYQMDKGDGRACPSAHRLFVALNSMRQNPRKGLAFDLQCGSDQHALSGRQMTRTIRQTSIVFFVCEDLEKPMLIDLLSVSGDFLC
jgi:hypothetical protein